MKPERLVILFQKNILRWFYRLRPQTRTTRKRSLQLWPTEAICFLFYWKIKLSWEGHSWETRKRMNLSPTSSWCRQVSSDRKLLPHGGHYFLTENTTSSCRNCKWGHRGRAVANQHCLDSIELQAQYIGLSTDQLGALYLHHRNCMLGNFMHVAPSTWKRDAS